MIIESISPDHNRLGFSSGNDQLDRYLHEQAHQAKRKGLAATFVAVDLGEPATILGYYSLSCFTISGLEILEVARRAKGLPRHDRVPATLLGRLAIAKEAQGRGLGPLLLSDALKRAYLASRQVGSVAVVVDAVDPSKVGFYEHYGFIRLLPTDLRLVMLMDTVAQLLPHVAVSPIMKEAI